MPPIFSPAGKKRGNGCFAESPLPFLISAFLLDAEAFTYNADTREKVRKEFGFSEGQLVVGHVGRFSYPKNHEFLVDCFDALRKKVPDARLLLVGDDKGKIGEEIHEKIRLLGLEESVIFAGLRSDVQDLMQAMDVFPFPSRYEGLPVTLIEAQASGLPCLISDMVPIECKKTDLVSQIASDASPEHWANEILNASETERKDTARQIIESGFDISENAKRLQEFYEVKSNNAEYI